MGPIINWIVRHVLTAIEEHLDPTLKTRWNAILARGRALDDARAALDRKEFDLNARLTASEQRQAELQIELDKADRSIAADEEKLAAIAERRAKTANDLKQAEAAVDSRDPDVERERPLPTG